jgi:ABC-type antimicrobial peptide transport system permease subunit
MSFTRLAAAAFIALIAVTFLVVCSAHAQPVAEPLPEALNVKEVIAHVEVLSSFESRFTGYPGYYKSVEYVVATLRGLGLDAELHEFNATTPVDYGAEIEVDSSRIKGYHLYPNLVALGAGNVSGFLAYAGTCSPEDLAGIDLAGKIAVVEFDSNWVEAVARGAKAIIFLSPAADRLSALGKILQVPLDVPRVYVGEGSDLVREAAKKGAYATITGRYEWRQVKAYNVVARIPGTSEPEKVVVLAAHLDSGSIVPALSPGAEEAVNVGLLLHLAKLLKEWKPKYTVWLLFLSGHWQGLAGARWFVEDYLFGGRQLFGTRVGENAFPYIVLNFDLSSGNPKLAVYPGGFFYGQRTQGAINLYSDLKSDLDGWLKEFYSRYPLDCERISSEAMLFNATTGITILQSFSTGYAIGCAQPFYLDAEPFQLAKIPAVAFLSFKDLRLKVFTPYDDVSSVNWGNVEPQARFAVFVLEKILSGSTTIFEKSAPRPVRIEVDPANGGFGYITATVEVIEYDPTIPTLYRAVPRSLVVVQKRDWYYNVMGSLGVTVFDPPYAKIIEMSDDQGRVSVVGLAPPETFTGNVEVYAYKVEDGHLTHVPDMGPNGLGKFLPYPPKLLLGTTLKAVVFKASALLLPSIAVPDQPWPLATLNRYGKPSYPVPYTRYSSPYPLGVSIFFPNLATPESYSYAVDYQNKLLLVFAPPESRICVIVSFGGEQRRAVIAINSSDSRINGIKLGAAGSVVYAPNAVKMYTSELLTLSLERYEKARSSGVVDPTSEWLLNDTLRFFRANATFGELWAAWSSSLKFYERTRGMSLDFATATLVVMLLIVPFTIIAEKLLFGRGGFRRITYVVGVAAATFALFAALHPGFSVVYSVYALSLGTVMAALTIPTLFFLLVMFNRALGYTRRAKLGAHTLERETFDLFVTALATGVENMKRRRLRSTLTLTTVILVVVSLVSLTSVVPVLKIGASSFESSASFSGILVKSPSSEPLDPVVIEVLANLLGKGYVVTPRYWLYPPVRGEFFTLTSDKGRVATFRAAIGVSAAELKASFKDLNIDPSIFAKVPSSCLLPKTIASSLGVEMGDLVEFSGLKMVVAGVFDDSLAEKLVRDIDDRVGETPYGGRPYDVDRLVDLQRFDPSVRIPWSEIVVVNSELLKSIPGAFLASVLILPREEASSGELANISYKIYNVFGRLDVYFSVNGQACLVSSRFVQEFFGFSFIAIPVVIGGFSLVLAILGSVHERMREASTYSALGLAPAHVGGMFLAEVVVYAIIGVVAGYAVGIAAARVFNFAVATGGFVGMNYSSSSVLTSLAVVTAMILAASIYPFARVSKLVTPSLERKWRAPTKPRGDTWEIPLPFTFREEEMAAGLAAYLSEYLENRRERVGAFAVMEHHVRAEAGRVAVKARIWLAPYEQNIVQDTEIVLAKSATEARYIVTMKAVRESGPYDLWVKSCETFIREMREQLLTWRLLKPEERTAYVRKGLEMVRAP